MSSTNAHDIEVNVIGDVKYVDTRDGAVVLLVDTFDSLVGVTEQGGIRIIPRIYTKLYDPWEDVPRTSMCVEHGALKVYLKSVRNDVAYPHQDLRFIIRDGQLVIQRKR